MTADVRLAHVAALLADPSRARMVMVLMDGRARTAKELASLANISPATASAHLAKLSDLGLIIVNPQGRHRYHRLASPRIAEMIEAIATVSVDALGPGPVRTRADAELQFARTCYDHLAGRLAVAIADRLQDDGHVVLTADGGEVTDTGRVFFAAHGFGIAVPARTHRIFCRPCIDWTERRPHLAGYVGAVICSCAKSRGWVRGVRDGRALTVTEEGRRGLAETFGIDVADLGIRRGGPASAAA